jgi:hypothetical protein
MRLLLLWLLGVPALVVAMAIASQVVGCRNNHADPPGQAGGRCSVLVSSTLAR